jgi:hypothetical protein
MKIEQKIAEMQDEQLAKKIASLLNEQSHNLTSNIAFQLNYSRQQALANIQRSPSSISISQNGILLLILGLWNQRRLFMTTMIGGLGLVALLTFQNLTNQEVYGQEDADLLGSDLPPEAYLNEGFDTWLSENAQ